MKKQSSGPTFSERVIKIALSIPKGRVTTYGRIARAAGGGNMASQSVSSVLSRAEDRGIKNIPWHRIVYADGHVWMHPKYRAKRLALYKKERIRIDKKDRIDNFRDILLEFN